MKKIPENSKIHYVATDRKGVKRRKNKSKDISISSYQILVFDGADELVSAIEKILGKELSTNDRIFIYSHKPALDKIYREHFELLGRRFNLLEKIRKSIKKFLHIV